MTLNPTLYREKLRKTLVESDNVMPPIQSAPVKPVNAAPGVLDSLREKLFGAATEGIATSADAGEDTGLPVGGDTYQKDPAGDPSMGPESDGVTVTADDLNDLATDTIAEVLNSIKELRDQVKKENPKKAALVRRIYDHLLKGKDKITAEILKSHEEEQNQQQPQAPAIK